MTKYVLRTDETCSMSDAEYADWLAKHGATIDEIQNPITRNMIKVDPSFTCHDGAQLDEFTKYVSLWCEAMWMIGRMDPAELKADRGWVAATPSWYYGNGKDVPPGFQL